MKKLLLLLAILPFAISCKQSEKRDEKIKWDFTNKDFKDKELRLLDMYNVFSFTKHSDSTIIYEGEIFKGWRNKALNIKDTLKLIENYFVQDSLGNQTTQILSYSKSNQTYFQLIVKREMFNSVDGAGKKQTDIWFNYSGKLFINKKDFQYFGNHLYTK